MHTVFFFISINMVTLLSSGFYPPFPPHAPPPSPWGSNPSPKNPSLKSSPRGSNFEGHITGPRLNSQPLGSNPSLKAQTPASRPKHRPQGEPHSTIYIRLLKNAFGLLFCHIIIFSCTTIRINALRWLHVLAHLASPLSYFFLFFFATWQISTRSFEGSVSLFISCFFLCKKWMLMITMMKKIVQRMSTNSS